MQIFGLDSLSVFDTESSGLDVETDRPIELAWTKVEKGEIVVQKSYLIKQDGLDNNLFKITKGAEESHGITVSLLIEKGVPAAEVYKEFVEDIKEGPIAAYNLSFDFQLLRNDIQRVLKINPFTPLEVPRLDIMEFAYILISPLEVPNYKQHTIAEYFNIKYEGLGEHRASSDVDVMLKIIDNLSVLYKAQYKDMTIGEFLSEHRQPARVPFGKHKGLNWSHRAVQSYCEYMVEAVMKKRTYLRNCCLYAIGREVEPLPYFD